MYYLFLFGIKLFDEEKLLSIPLKANAKRHREPHHTSKRMTLYLSKPHFLNSDSTYAILQTYEVLHNLFKHICFFLAECVLQFVQTG